MTPVIIALVAGLAIGAYLSWLVKRHLLLTLGWTGEPRYIPQSIREWVAVASLHTCIYCGRKGGNSDPDGHPWEIDHVVPLRAGGAHAVRNFALSCRECNRSKSDKMPPMPVVSLKPRRTTDE